MSDKSYTSSAVYVVFLPVANVILLLMCVGGLLTFPSVGAAWFEVVGFAVLSGFLAWALWTTWGKYAVVTVDDAGVRVRQGSKEHHFQWTDVDTFWTVPFVTPPIHRLTFRSSELVVYFVPVIFGSLNIGVWTFHFSGMGRYIKQQMRGVAPA